MRTSHSSRPRSASSSSPPRPTASRSSPPAASSSPRSCSRRASCAPRSSAPSASHSAPRRAADARRPRAARASPARRPRAPCAPPRRRRYTVDAPGVPEVRHFVYRVGEQFTAPRVGVHAGAQCPYRDRAAVKQLMRRYQSVHARVHALPKPLREYLQVTDRETIFAWTSAEYELYVARLGHAPSLTPRTPYPPLSLSTGTSSTSPSARSRASPSPSRRPTGCSAGSRRSSRACSSCTPSR